MLKVRKKAISLIVVLSFLVTLFPLALPALGADYSRVGAVVSVSDGQGATLNRVRVEFAKGELQKDDSVIISLPRDFEFRKALDAKAQAMTEADWNSNEDTFPNKITMSYDSGDSVAFKVSKLNNNEIKLEISDAVDDTEKVTMFLDLGAVYVDDGYDGDIPLTFDVATGGFPEGDLVVGRVTSGKSRITVVDYDNFGDRGGEVTLRIREDRAGALEADPESVTLTLPKGFEWGNVTSKLIDGVQSEVDGWVIDADADNQDELVVSVDEKTSTKAAYIEIVAWIDVADETRAKFGDVTAKVGGKSDVTLDPLRVGNHGDYEIKVSADNPTTVYAGFVEQEIANVTIEESVEDSLVDGRSITLTLPELYKWGSLPDEVGDEGDDCYLELVGFPGRDGQTAKYLVHNDRGGGIEKLEFEDMEIIISPKVMPGEVAITFGGTAGVKGEVKVAEVTKPVVMKFENVPTMAIGTQDQALAEITVTEVKPGMLKEGWPLVLILPPSIPWDDYEVEVIAGDLEIGKVYDMMEPLSKDEYLLIDIDDESTEVSTIKVIASVDIYRNIPEGRVLVGLGGPAIVEVQNHFPGGALYDQYGNAVAGYYQIGGFDIVDKDNLFVEHDTVSGGVGAIIGTPAPGEIKIRAVFTLGSTNYVLNDEEQTMDVAPYAKDGRTYLPMRYVANALGIPDSGISWGNGTATFISGDKVVSVTIGSKTMYINGAPVTIDVAPEIANGRTMLPIRWVAAAFGIDVSWDAATQTVTVE